MQLPCGGVAWCETKLRWVLWVTEHPRDHQGPGFLWNIVLWPRSGSFTSSFTCFNVGLMCKGCLHEGNMWLKTDNMPIAHELPGLSTSHHDFSADFPPQLFQMWLCVIISQRPLTLCCFLSPFPSARFLFQYNHMSEASLFLSNLRTIIKSALKTLENH